MVHLHPAVMCIRIETLLDSRFLLAKIAVTK